MNSVQSLTRTNSRLNSGRFKSKFNLKQPGSKGPTKAITKKIQKVPIELGDTVVTVPFESQPSSIEKRD